NVRAKLASPWFLGAMGIVMTLVCFFVFNVIVNLFSSTVTALMNIDFDQSFAQNNALLQSYIFTFDHFTRLSEYTGILLIGLVGIVLMVAYKLYEQHRRYRKLDVGQKGDSRFTTIKELKQAYKTVPHRDEKYDGESGFPISHYKEHYFIYYFTSIIC